MLFIRFEGFILALLIVSFALQNLSVHADHHQVVFLVERRLMGGNSIKEAQEKDASAKKEPIHVAGISRIAGVSSKEKVGGRKMGMNLKKRDAEMDSRSSTGDAQKLNVEADKNASKEGPQDFLDNQGQKCTLETMAINPKRSLQKQVSSLNTNHIISNEDQSDEWRKLLEEADQKVMQMMRRDYSGMRRPRRKPPINNQEPRN
ncbi:uncharacterized protein LOC111885839 isoform X1 [Lactuca sativa]|uniref:Uncharacterized protein n=1 Tax=Lactuca sativa TaxID=4236 RepID=A0A9R1VQ70_LACSA|nr:uncharacterized protein LOC111885839 isoform X1 [Lactuca sativa]KAJ0210500.1 hypothetical protein LSAT_V11C400223490 [Lactuca sativa]